MSDKYFSAGPWSFEYGDYGSLLDSNGKGVVVCCGPAFGSRYTFKESWSNSCLVKESPSLYAEIERDLIEQLKTQELIKGKLVDEQLNASIIRKQNLLAKARGEL